MPSYRLPLSVLHTRGSTVATPSTHPEAGALQARLAKVIAPATHSRDVRALVELLGNHREIGWVKGEERVRLVCDLCTRLIGMRVKVDLGELYAAFGAGPWELA